MLFRSPRRLCPWSLQTPHPRAGCALTAMVESLPNVLRSELVPGLEGARVFDIRPVNYFVFAYYFIFVLFYFIMAVVIKVCTVRFCKKIRAAISHSRISLISARARGRHARRAVRAGVRHYHPQGFQGAPRVRSRWRVREGGNPLARRTGSRVWPHAGGTRNPNSRPSPFPQARRMQPQGCRVRN